MMRLACKIILKLFSIIIFFTTVSFSEVIKQIDIKGNKRISKETITMFLSYSIGDNLDNITINEITKNIYDTNFFEKVSVSFKKNILEINVVEYPIIETIEISGIKAKRIRELISKNLKMRSRSSFNEFLLKTDKENILNSLKEIGYYFPKIDISIEELKDKKVKLVYDIDIGSKSKITKISFIGNKIYKDNKLRSIIVSEEFKLWKFISNNKYLSENNIELDKKLLKNFFLNEGYYDVEINSSFARLINDDQFELIFNINAKNKFYFDNIDLVLPIDFDEKNFVSLQNYFLDIKGKAYSIRIVENILNRIDKITTEEEFFNINASVEENLIEDKINLKFKITETEKFIVEKINIYGNNITRETVIRNQFAVDEGDPFNSILFSKTINNIKNLNFFKKVNSNISKGSNDNYKILDIFVEEKATGEISAGAGVGTSGGTIAFGVKENNYLGKGISLQTDATIDQESFKGSFSVTNPNYKNTDKSLTFNLQATELDRMKDFGYKSNKVGFSLFTKFEYLDDLKLGLGTSSFLEKIDTDSTASSLQRKQEGNYFDNFVSLDFDFDKRNQKFQTSDGFRSNYTLDIPIISEKNTLMNTYDYKYYTELYDQNITTFSLFFSSANSLTNDDIKLSERLYVPSKKLRGFEKGKIGPRDGNDFIGGNYVSSFNASTNLPQLFSNFQNMDALFFFDAASVWGVDYDSSLDDNFKIRSSTGIGLDWYTPVGPLNFSLALPLSKATNDKTESFRFNLGTTF